MPLQMISLQNSTPTLKVTSFPRLSSAYLKTSAIVRWPIKMSLISSRYVYSNTAAKSRSGPRNSGNLFKVNCETAQDDAFYMRRSLELAKKGAGYTSPNPMVGCVIVRDGRIVGEGFHPKAGQPHAEVFALRDAGSLAENATAYVSLEPCNHSGRTPPCTEALIKAKLKKVVVGMVDPNPIVASKGVDRLREAGIDVIVGVEEESCKLLNEAYIHKMSTGKPFVTLRYSMSLNGHIQDNIGEGGAEAGGYYSRLCHEYDAVVVYPGSSTENFLLPKSREPGANQPYLIVIASSSCSPFHLLDADMEATSKLILFTDLKMDVLPNTYKNETETVTVDQIGLNPILDYCNQQGYCSVLLDLRGDYSNFEALIKEGIEHNLLQKIVMEVLPRWETGYGKSFFTLSENLKLQSLLTTTSNDSVIVEGYI